MILRRILFVMCCVWFFTASQLGCISGLPDPEIPPVDGFTVLEPFEKFTSQDGSVQSESRPLQENGNLSDRNAVNCVASECVSPLPVCLSPTMMREFKQGHCHRVEDKCVFSYLDKKCAGVCKQGKCLQKTDPCAKITCNSPSSPKCMSEKTLRVFAKTGSCKDGKCSYSYQDQACSLGCKEGACKKDPCLGLSCKKPPASKCLSASTLRNYYLPGSCSSGTCRYPYADQRCPHGCEKSQCKLGSGFQPLSSFRFLDSRGGSLPASGSTRCIAIAGKGGVPKSARAVYINMVAVSPTGVGFLTVYPKGIALPNISTLNYIKDDTIANGSIVPLGSGGEICVYMSQSTHIVVDVLGYFASDSDFFPKGPYRRLDTRSGRPVANDSTQCYPIAGRNGIPTTAKAVFVNLVAVNPSASGFLSVYPKGTSLPNASNLNYLAGQTIANGAVVKLGTGGEICVFAKSSTHLILDVSGFFGSSSSLTPIDPKRRVDTRQTAQLGSGVTKCYQVAGRDGIPSDAKAVAVNLTAVYPTARGYLTVYPDGLSRPTVSSLNYGSNITRGNNSIVKVGTGGRVCVYTFKATHFILDVVGYWKSTGSGNRCSGVSCSSPPPQLCVGGKDLVSYASKGSCTSGVCVYKQTVKSCAWKCVGSKCVSAPPPPPPPPPPPKQTFHPVTAWQSPSEPVNSGSRMNLLALRYITLHYNGGNLDLDGKDNVYQDSDFAQILRNMQHGYLVNRKYSLGYNSAVAPDGDEWEIRGLRFRAAANGCTAVNQPAYTIIIPVSSVNSSPTAAQVQGVRKVIARIRAAAKRAGNPHTLTVNGHRDVRPKCGGGGTACPGNHIYGLIQKGSF